MRFLNHPGPWTRLLVSMILLALVALSWTRQLDDAAEAATKDNFTRALTVAGLARAMNGVISVAQGTEVAIQPVGICVTLTIGEILDPLNDLVERFSWLALLASISLGIQLSLSEMIGSMWLSGVVTAAIVGFVGLMWLRPSAGLTSSMGKAVVIILGARFLLAIVLLISWWLDATFLSVRADDAMAQLSYTTDSLEQLNEQTTTGELGPLESDAGIIERTSAQLRGLLDSSRQTLDLRAQLAQLQQMTEDSVEQIINLIVIFLLQTIVLPLTTGWVCWQALKSIWIRLFHKEVS